MRGFAFYLTVASILQVGFQGDLRPAEDSSRVDPDVPAGLAAAPSGRIYVLIRLKPPGIYDPDRRRGVSDRQRAVLDTLGREFEVAYRYVTVAGLAGHLTAEGLRALETSEWVLSVGLDRRGTPAAEAAVPDPRPWFEAGRVHDELGVTGKGTTVAVIDTGANPSDPELSDSIAEGAYHFSAQGQDVGPGADDSLGHGTTVSTIITAKGINAPVGIAPDAKVLPIRVSPDFFGSDVVAAIDHVVSNRERYGRLAAMNMSFGYGGNPTCPCDGTDTLNGLLQSAILEARQAGIACFAAPGNDDSCTTIWSPACLSAVTSVGAVSQRGDGSFEPFGNRGDCLGVFAPGVGGGGVATSWSSAHGTGLAALMAEAKACLSAPVDEVVSIMKRTGTPVPRGCPEDPATPLINAYRAVSEVLSSYRPPAEIVRETSQDTYAPGDTIEVNLRVISDAPLSDASVKEVLPELIAAQEISHQGVQTGNTIEWVTGNLSGDLSYRISPPPCAGDLSFGAGTFRSGDSWGCLSGTSVVTRSPDVPGCAVVRDLSPESYRPGDGVTVTLRVTSDLAGADGYVEEVVPDPAEVSDISDMGIHTGSAIRWNLNGISVKPLTYRVSLPACVDDLAFDGSFQLGIQQGRVSGKTVLQRQPGDQEIDPWENTGVGTTGGYVDPLGADQLFIDGRGAGVRQSADEFHFVHLPQEGDFRFSARLDCFGARSDTAQAGLMVRDTLDPFSATICFFFARGSGDAGGTLYGVFRRETSSQRTIAPISISQKAVDHLPISLRIERTGNRISLLRSDDGLAYTEVGQKLIGSGSTTQVNLKTSTLVGLAVSGGDGSAPAIFSEVSGPAFVEPAGPSFHRGDPNSSGTSDISDGISIFGFLFLGETAPDCRESADANNDGTLDISDGVFLLAWLFMGGPEPPAPGPTGTPCGPDPDAPGSAGDLGCQSYLPCS